MLAYAPRPQGTGPPTGYPSPLGSGLRVRPRRAEPASASRNVLAMLFRAGNACFWRRKWAWAYRPPSPTRRPASLLEILTSRDAHCQGPGARAGEDPPLQGQPATCGAGTGAEPYASFSFSAGSRGLTACRFANRDAGGRRSNVVKSIPGPAGRCGAYWPISRRVSPRLTGTLI